MARILSIVRCRLKDEGGGTFGSSTPPRHNQGGHPPWTPLLYHTPALLGYGMSTVRVQADLMIDQVTQISICSRRVLSG